MEDSFARALRSRLRDEAHPYKRRLKLCQKLSKVKELSNSESTNCVLVEWVAGSISLQGDAHSDESALHQWKLLHNLLQSVLQHDPDLMVIRRYLPSRLFQIFVNWLSQFEYMSEDMQIQVACCCKIAIQNRNLLETLLLNFIDFASLLPAIITALSMASNSSTYSDLQTILALLLEKNHVSKMLHVDREKGFEMGTQQLLKPIAKLLHKHCQTSSEDKTLELIKTLLGSFLFSKNLERYFRQMLDVLLSETFRDDCPQFLRDFLTILQEELEDHSFISKKVAVCFPVILEGFLSQYKTLPCQVKFHFIALLVRLLGIESTKPEKEFFKNKQFFTATFFENEAGFSILADLLFILGKHSDIYYTADQTGIKPTEWLQELMQFLIVKTCARCKSWFKCLQALLVIDNKIITSNFHRICEVAWLSLDQLDPDVKQAQSAFFCQVVTTFTKLQQATNFIDKILNTLSFKVARCLFKQFTLPVGVLEKFDAMCGTLTFGQVVHLWKLFTNYVMNTYIPQMTESSDVQVIRHYVNPVLELMSSFLINGQFVEHITNIPNITKDIIMESRNTSKSCLMPLLLESLKAKDVILLRNTLNLAHSWGEAHLMLLNYNPGYGQLWKEEKNEHISISDAFSDLTPVHFYIGTNEWHLIYMVCAETEEPALQFMFARLLAQKIRALLSIKENASEVVRSGIIATASQFVKFLKTCERTQLWDTKISSINETNLPVALWSLFTESLPVLVPYLPTSDIMTVARIMVSTFHEDISDACNQSNITKSLIHSQHVSDLIVIQSALTIALHEDMASVIDAQQSKMKNGKVLWDEIYKLFCIMSSTPEIWLQYANSTPINSENGLNPLWSVIKDAAVILSNAFRISVNQESLKFSIKYLPLHQLLHRLRFLNQLPLEYFVPGNQIYCLFGIFAQLISIVHSTHCDIELVECIIQSLKTVLALVDSMRSNWLFNLIKAQDLLLWVFGPFTIFQTQLSANDSISSELRIEFRNISRQFLEVMLNLVRGNSTVFNDFDTFLAEVELLPNWKQVDDQGGSEQMVSFAVIMMELFHKMQRSSNKALLTTCHNCISRISKSFIHWFSAFVNANGDSSNLETQRMIAPFLNGFNILLEFQMNTDKEILQEHHKQFKHWKKLIPEVKRLISQVSNFSEDSMSIESCCQIMCNFCKHRDTLKKYVSNDVLKETWCVVKSHLQSSLQNQQSPEFLIDEKLKQRTGFMKQLIGVSNNSEFDWLLRTILNDFNGTEIQHSNVDEVKLVLHLWNMLASASLTCDQKIILEKHSKKFIILCQHTLYKIMQQEEHSWEIIISVIEAQASLIKNTKMATGRITVCLQGLAFVDLLQVHDSLVYGKCIEMICLLLNNMLISKRKILEDMTPPFITAVQDVIKSVIQKGQQEFLKDAPEDEVMLICGCAQNIERLLAQIAITSLDLTKVASYIIAHFVTESYSVTLYPAVKTYLTEGIYAIMSLCDDHAVAALQASLNDTARQVFNSMHETYVHYYQYKGKV